MLQRPKQRPGISERFGFSDGNRKLVGCGGMQQVLQILRLNARNDDVPESLYHRPQELPARWYHVDTFATVFV